MTTVIVLGPCRQIEEQLIQGLTGRNSNDEFSRTEDQVFEVKRKVTIQPNQLNGHSHELFDRNRNEGLPIQENSHGHEDSTRMDCDGGDSTDDVEQRMDDLKSNNVCEPRMKYLKSFSAQSTSHTDETCVHNEAQETNVRTVDVYMLDIANNEVLISKVVKSCIPDDGLIIVPKPINEDGKANIEKVLRSFLDDETMKGNKTIPQILVVDMQSKKPNDQPCKEHLISLVEKEQIHACTLDDLRNTVHTLLSYFPQGDYKCLEDIHYDRVFVAEGDLPSDIVKTLLNERKIIRFNIPTCKTCFVCTCPEKLVSLFSYATRHCRQWKIEMSKLLTEMKMNDRKPVALAALSTECFIYTSEFSRTHVCIAHMFSPQRVNIELLELSPESNALRFSTSDDVDMKKILASCDLLGWNIKEAYMQDVFLLSNDNLAVLLWSERSYFDGTSIIYMCEVDKLETSDNVRNCLDKLRQCVKKCIGGNKKSSIYHRNEKESYKAACFIQEHIPSDWLDTNDASLYYKKDAIALLSRWLSSSTKAAVQQILCASLDDKLIAKLSAIFGTDYDIFFIEQGVDSATVDQIRINYPLVKNQVTRLLKVWTEIVSIDQDINEQRKEKKHTLYTLRQAIADSAHNPVDLMKFDSTVDGFLTGRQNASLI